ncbi:MAG: hypothetical protein COA94_03680 [Rickettsiales bacterium]|nr:MAG: hypothetical protein COA94_03680 [Rickettsiales bacterium]
MSRTKHEKTSHGTLPTCEDRSSEQHKQAAPDPPAPELQKNLSNNLLKLLCQHGLTERELAERIGASQGHINKLKNGHARLSNIDYLVRIAEVFGVSLEQLLTSPGHAPPITHEGKQKLKKITVYVVEE